MSTLPPRQLPQRGLILGLLTLSLATQACGGENDPGEKPPATYLKDGEQSDGGAADAGAVAQDAGDSGAAVDTHVAAADTATSDAGGFPDGFLEPLDDTVEGDASATDTGPAIIGPVGQLYAHTATNLFQLDLDKKAFVDIGKFVFDKNGGPITDIALDRYGALYAVSFSGLYKCVATSAKCTWLAKLPSPFNGMTVVAEDVVTPGEEALIGISDKGVWTHIDMSSGSAKLKALGSYGGGWLSSGDAFSVVGIGTFATLKGKGDTDTLARVDPKTGKIIKLIGQTGATGLYGLAWWNGVFYGFSSSGKIYTLDINTGKGTEVSGFKIPEDVKWWGAGVSTRANGG